MPTAYETSDLAAILQDGEQITILSEDSARSALGVFEEVIVARENDNRQLYEVGQLLLHTNAVITLSDSGTSGIRDTIARGAPGGDVMLLPNGCAWEWPSGCKILWPSSSEYVATFREEDATGLYTYKLTLNLAD